jgi:hypothetical protein
MGDSDDVKQLLDLLAAGSFRKAIHLLNSLGVMVTTEFDVQQQLRTKHPQRGDLGGEPTSMPTPGEYNLPGSYSGSHTNFIHLPAEDVGTTCFGLARDKAKSPNGTRNEHLTPFGFTHTPLARERRLPLRISPSSANATSMSSSLPRYYCLSASARLVALLKEKIRAGSDAKVRPLAVDDVERRLFCSMLVRMTGSDFADWLGPYQVAVGVKASAEKLAFELRTAMERLPTFALWKLDLKNAFNEFVRAVLVPRFAAAPPAIRRLLIPFVCALLDPGAKLAMGEGWADFLSAEGTQQGCPLGSPLFCLWFSSPTLTGSSESDSGWQARTPPSEPSWTTLLSLPRPQPLPRSSQSFCGACAGKVPPSRFGSACGRPLHRLHERNSRWMRRSAERRLCALMPARAD